MFKTKSIIIFIILIILIKAHTFSQTFYQLSDSAQHYTAKSDYKTALLWAEKSLRQAEKEFGKKDTLYANTLTALAEICFYKGSYEKGVSYIKEEITIRKEIQGENHPYYATPINNLAMFYQTMGRYPEAEELFLNAKRILKNQLGETHPDYATTLNNLAGLYLIIGRYPEAEELYLKTKEIDKIQLGETHPYYATDLNNLALLYKSMGLYPEAEELHLKAIEIDKIQLGENHPDYATSLNNLALLYKTMERYTEAEELFLISNNIRKTHDENHPEYAITLNNLAGLYQIIGHYTKAEELILKAKNIRKTQLGENHPYYAGSLNNLALLYETMNRFPEAEELYLKAKEIDKIRLDENHPDYATTLNNLAGLYEKMERNKESNFYFQQALQEKIYQINDHLPGMSEKEKGSFFNTIKGDFEHYYSFALSNYKSYKVDNVLPSKVHSNRVKRSTIDDEWQKQIPVSIMQYQLITKSLMFNAANKMRENILNSGDTTLVQLFRTWKSKRDYLAKLFTLSKKEIEKQGVSIKTLEIEINSIEKELSKKSVLFEEEVGKKETTWQDVQSQLMDSDTLTNKEGEAFVEMIRFRKYGTVTKSIHYKDSVWDVKNDGFTDTVYYAALILKSKENPKLIILENGNELEEMYYAGYKLSIKHFRPYPEGYVQYWERIAKELNGIKTIYFSADGVYNQINLNTLQNPQTGKYLLEEIDIRLVTSSKNLVRKQKLGECTASLYGYVNYDNNIASEDLGELPVLPGTQQEVINIEMLLKEKNWKTQMYQMNKANEGAIKNEKSPTVLHIATHGYFLAEQKIKGRKVLGIDSIYFSLNPLLKSGLLLATDTTAPEKVSSITETGLGLRGKEQDGILTAYEAMNLNLDNTELVVLSACETGQGDVVAGEGVFGLQRAFQQAGSKAVIMSLWSVSDQHTQELMTLFYTKWLSGINKSDAFKQTQVEMKSKYKYPYYWGAFVMVGN